MMFASGDRVTRRPVVRQLPERPILLVTLALRSTRVESEEFRGAADRRQHVALIGLGNGSVDGAATALRLAKTNRCRR
jgi:hypothetical protein